MKHIFILNPIAGSGFAKSLERDIIDLAEKKNIDYILVKSEYEKHAIEIAKEYSVNNNHIYSIGGDGTAFETLNGLDKEKAYFSIIPAGTGNDFYRMIDQENTTIIKKIEEAIDGKVVEVDYGLSNGRCFLNSTTVGLDARINNIVCNIFKKTIMPKSIMYGLASVFSLLNPKPFKAILKISYEDEKGQVIYKNNEVKSLLIAVMNGKYYGNGIKPSDRPNIADGYFDILVVENMNIFKLFKLLPRFFKGDTENIVGLNIYKSKDVEIELDKEIDAQSDGENFKTKYLKLQMVHKGLRLIVPKKSKL